MSISKKLSLVSHEQLFDPNSEKVEGFYKDKNFIIDIATPLMIFWVIS